jgi:hypothetical protein
MVISSFILATALMLSPHIQGADAYVGDDMTDEDFKIFVEKNSEQFDKARSFMYNHRDALYRGMIGGAVGYGLKNIVKNYPGVGGMIIAGAVEFAKEIYKETNGNSKDERLDQMQRELDNLKSLAEGMNERMQEVHRQESEAAEDYNKKQDSYREKVKDQEKLEGAMHRYNMQHDPDYRAAYVRYTSDPSNCGAHNDHYRFYRDPETREIHETIDRVYHDSVNPRSEYVTPNRYENEKE